jgi:hypothetical protein
MAVALLLEEEDYEFDDDVRYEDFFNKKISISFFFFSPIVIH